MTAFVLEVINRFLTRNGLDSRPEDQPPSSQRHPGSPRKRPRRDDLQSASRTTASSTTMPSTRPQTPTPGKSSKHTHHDSLTMEELSLTQDDSGYFEWTDPSSGESFPVDSNTGNSFPSKRVTNHLHETPSASYDDSLRRADASYVDRRWLKSTNLLSSSSRSAVGDTRTTVPEWLTKALQVSGTGIGKCRFINSC